MDKVVLPGALGVSSNSGAEELPVERNTLTSSTLGSPTARRAKGMAGSSTCWLPIVRGSGEAAPVGVATETTPARTLSAAAVCAMADVAKVDRIALLARPSAVKQGGRVMFFLSLWRCKRCP